MFALCLCLCLCLNMKKRRSLRKKEKRLKARRIGMLRYLFGYFMLMEEWGATYLTLAN